MGISTFRKGVSKWSLDLLLFCHLHCPTCREGVKFKVHLRSRETLLADTKPACTLVLYLTQPWALCLSTQRQSHCSPFRLVGKGILGVPGRVCVWGGARSNRARGTTHRPCRIFKILTLCLLILGPLVPESTPQLSAEGGVS